MYRGFHIYALHVNVFDNSPKTAFETNDSTCFTLLETIPTHRDLFHIQKSKIKERSRSNLVWNTNFTTKIKIGVVCESSETWLSKEKFQSWVKRLKPLIKFDFPLIQKLSNRTFMSNNKLSSWLRQQKTCLISCCIYKRIRP